MKVLVFGNPLYPEDSIAHRVAARLKGKFSFAFPDSMEELEKFGRDLVILDAAEGIEKVVLIEDLCALRAAPSYSMHDFDIALTLKLLKKLKKIDSVKIVAVPKNMDQETAALEAESIFKSILP